MIENNLHTMQTGFLSAHCLDPLLCVEMATQVAFVCFSKQN